MKGAMSDSKMGKAVVITGSTRGLGRGLAEAFLGSGAKVAISGRSQETAEGVAAELGEEYGEQRVWGTACDVRDRAQVLNLWEKAGSRFGRVDIWVNNAGVGLSPQSIWQNRLDEIRGTLDTNVWGTILGSVVAVRGMMDQGGGWIFNMEGLGSDGRKVSGLAIYGTTKYGLDYFNQALIEETRATPVRVGTLSPGMVATDMTDVRYPEGSEEAKRFRQVMNLIGDRPENVAPWLVERMLTSTTHGARIKYLTWTRMLRRVVAMPFRDRHIFDGGPSQGP